MISYQLLYVSAIFFYSVKCENGHRMGRRGGLFLCFVPNQHVDRPSMVVSNKYSSQISFTSLQSTRDPNKSDKNAVTIPKPKYNARSVAITALTDVSHRNSSISEPQYYLRKLETDPKFLLLQDQRDRSFARNLVGTTERRLGQIDKILHNCCEGYPPKKKIVQACLRAGVCQLVFLKVPPFAAVKETVDVLRMPGLQVPETFIKFVNAVLRKVSREGTQLLQKHTEPADNVSPWLLQELQQAWGVDNTNKIINQMMIEPHIYLTPKLPLGRVPSNEQQRLLDDFCSSFNMDSSNYLHILPNGSLRAEESLMGHVSSWPLYNDGCWWVQDIASTIPALGLIKILDKERGDLTKLHVVDFCAAPGGKTAQLLSAGFKRVTAIESNMRRSKKLRENLDRLKLHDTCEVIVTDGLSWFPEKYDVISGILLDVPCSSTGTGARHGSVLRKTKNLDELIDIQKKLANHCADILPSDSIMVYSTCSLLKQESEDQIESLLMRGDLETVPFTRGEILGFEDAIDKNGWIRVLPGVLEGDLSSSDGFFVARLRKKV